MKSERNLFTMSAQAGCLLIALLFSTFPLLGDQLQMWQVPIVDIVNETERKISLRVTYEDPDLIPTEVEVFAGGHVILRAKTFKRISAITLNGQIVEPWEQETRYHYTIDGERGFESRETRIAEEGAPAIWEEMNALNQNKPTLPQLPKNWASDLHFWKQEGVKSVRLSGGRLLYSE